MCYFFLFPPKQIRIRVCNLHPGPEVDTHAIFHAFPCTSFGHDISIFCLLQEWRENKTSYIIWPSGNSPVCYGTPSFLVGKYVVNHLWNSINAYIILYIYICINGSWLPVGKLLNYQRVRHLRHRRFLSHRGRGMPVMPPGNAAARLAGEDIKKPRLMGWDGGKTW